MRPQGLWRSFGLIQRATTRSFLPAATSRQSIRNLSSAPKVPDFAFAFDIDGVLLRSSKPIPGAAESLALLKKEGIPFILLTNGGGKHETERVAEISEKLQVPLDAGVIIQSHSPFAEMVQGTETQTALENKRVLVVGGEGNRCRQVAEQYGFRNVVTPGDIFMANPSIWPFSKVFQEYYKTFAKPIPHSGDPTDPTKGLKIDAILVFNDPRDWALDAHMIVDLLLSSQGVLGTLSEKNGRTDLPNHGYQQDGQPPLYFSNPDLWWAAAYSLPRLGQGGFREALEGTWSAITGGASKGVVLKKTVMGKPSQGMYEFAENQLLRNRARTFGFDSPKPLRNVYMVGDNPESDIRGANSYRSAHNSQWHSILVRSGVYRGGEPAWTPKMIADDVRRAVDWALQHSKWQV
ncbi:HAD-like domain-containing protein [Aspergillus egyptiacus]|nr:HAD-like domain-containing protein [Aspergillus egyptiacus]